MHPQKQGEEDLLCSVAIDSAGTVDPSSSSSTAGRRLVLNVSSTIGSVAGRDVLSCGGLLVPSGDTSRT